MAGHLAPPSDSTTGSFSRVPPTPSPTAELPSSPLPECKIQDDSKSKVFDCGSESQVQSSSRWADIVRKDSIEARNELKFFPSLAGGAESSVFSPPPEVVNEGQAFWGFTLVGHFYDSPPHFVAIKAIVKKIWARFGLTHIASNVFGFFFFRFSSMETMEKCIQAGPWLLAGKAIFLKRWTPGMILNKEELNRFPIWIKLLNVPIEYWTLDGLSWVASAVGIPLQLDPRTARMENVSYAIICVEVGVDGPFPTCLNIKSCHDSAPIVVKVEYSWRSFRCSRCCLLGHIEAHCHSKVLKPPTGNSSSNFPISAPPCTEHLTDGCIPNSGEVSCSPTGDALDSHSLPEMLVPTIPVTSDHSLVSLPDVNHYASSPDARPPPLDPIACPPVALMPVSVHSSTSYLHEDFGCQLAEPPIDVEGISGHCHSLVIADNSSQVSVDVQNSLVSGGTSGAPFPSVMEVSQPIIQVSPPSQLDLVVPSNSHADNGYQGCLLDASGCLVDSQDSQIKDLAPNSPYSGPDHLPLDLDEYLLTPSSIKRISLKYSSNSSLVDELRGIESDWKISKTRKKKKTASRKSRGASGS